MTDLPPITSIVGGVGGLAAEYAEIRALGSSLADVGCRCLHWAATAGAALVDPRLLASDALAPGSFAHVERALVLASGHGVLDAGLWEADALGCHLAVELLEDADEVSRSALDALDYTIGRELGTLLSPIAFAVDNVPDPLWDQLVDRLGPPAPGGPGCVDAFVLDHPTITRHLLNGSGGLLDGLDLSVLPLVDHPTAESAAAEASTWYDVPGQAAVAPGPASSGSGAADLSGLLSTLEAVNERPAGTIAVETMTGPDGPVHIVFLPGTDALGMPWEFDPAVRDAQTDLAAVGGLPNAYADGVRQALAAAQVGHEPVLLVGHSLGGVIATQLAHDDGLNVAGVITAGSPATASPAGIPVLSLSNRGDVVPMLLGDAPRGTVDHVTVEFDDHEASVIGNHDLSHYVAGAEAVEASADPSIRSQLDGWQPFLTGAPATVQEFTITRAP